jgi:PAS domain S-box-containing protein
MNQSKEEFRRQIAALQAENDALRARAEGAEEALTAIQNGEVDALVVYGEDGAQVYTLEGADHTYRVIVEKIQEGVATLQPDGMVLYANQRLADMLGIPLQSLLGASLFPYIHASDQKIYTGLLARSQESANRVEVTLRRGDGGVVPVQLSMILVESLGERFVCLVATDLTERKRQEAILKAEQLSRSILEQAAEMIVVCDLQGMITRVSQAAEDILPGNPLLRPFEEAFPLQWVNRENSEKYSIRAILKGASYRGVDAVLERPIAEGTEKLHLLVSATPLVGENNSTLGCIVTLTDITARKQAEQKIRWQNAVLAGINRIFREAMTQETEENLGRLCLEIAEQLTQSKFGFIGEVQPDGLLQDVAISDPGWVQCQMDDQSGHRQRPGDFKIHDLYGEVIRTGKSLLVNQPRAHPASIGAPEGHPSLMAFLGVPLLRDGQAIGIIAVGDRKGGYEASDQEALEMLAPAVVESFARIRAEIALRVSEERYRSLVEHSPFAIMIQVDGRYAYLNPAAVKLFGAASQEEILGQSILERAHPAHHPTIEERIHITNVERRTADLVEGMFLRMDGSTFFTEAISVPFTYQGKAGALVMAQDVSGQRALEAQSRADAARIEVQRHLIDQREQERLRIARDLHDGPVQELIGISYALHGLAQARAEQDPKDELRPIAKAIMDQIAELRAYAGELRPPTLFRFGLVKALRSHMETLGEKHPELEIALEVECQEEDLPDEIRLGLFRVYQEAVNNIIRHARATRLEVHFKEDDSHAALEIFDNGVGFTLPRDWLELARRGHLGLVGMRERTEAMGGTIRISSQPGSTRIEVSVPLGKLGECWSEQQ